MNDNNQDSIDNEDRYNPFNKDNTIIFRGLYLGIILISNY